MLPLMLQTLLVAGLLTVLVLIVGPVFRLSPAVRYGLWLVVLIKLLVPPVVDWPWDAPALVGEAVTLQAFFRPAEVTLPASARLAEAPAIPVQVVGESENRTVWSPAGLPVRSLFWIAWALGSLFVFVTLSCRILRFRRVVSRSDPAPDHIVDIVEGVARRLRIPAPEVRVARGSSGPCVWSLGRPVVVIPAAMLANEDVGFWQHVFSHELAHIRRRDHWFVWLEFVGFVLWWWNPLYWLVQHRLRSNAELAADNWAVSLNPDNRRQYAEALLWVAERGSRMGAAMPALGAARRTRTQFAKRLTLILVGDHGVRVSMPGTWGLLLLLLVVWPNWGLREVLPALVEAPTAQRANEADLKTTITLWAYDVSGAGEVVLPATTRFMFPPWGTAQEGDDRVMFILHHPVTGRGEATGFAPVMVWMPLADARRLHADMAHVISTRPSTENERDGMESLIDWGMYSNGKSQGRSTTLGNQATWRVMPRYIGVDRHGEAEVDDRVTLVLEDLPNSFWPVIVRMDSGIAQAFADDLARAISEKSEGG